MNKTSILDSNERAANKFTAKVMLVTIGFVALTMLLNILQIFVVPMKTMSLAMGAATIMLLLPAVLVFILKLDGWMLKYVTVTAAVLMVASLSTLLSYHVVLLYIYPLAIASLYFSRRLSWFASLLTIAAVTVSQYMGIGMGGVVDKNFTEHFELLVYGILPRDIQLLAISIIFILLSKRTRGMLQNVVGAEEQKNLLERTLAVTDKARAASDTLAASVDKLSGITAYTTQANEQIARNASKIANGSESTLKLVEEAEKSAETISQAFNMVAVEGQKIADVSLKVARLTKDNGEVIGSAVEKMEEIGHVTEQNRIAIMKLGEQSEQIGRIVEIITGIAGQTNMLALNAAIESARAGEQGRGFAVVAGEIRSLAEQSERAAKDIAKLVRDIITDTGNAVAAMEKGAETVEEGLAAVREAGNAFDKVSAEGAQMDGMVQEVSKSTTEAAKNSDKLTEIVSSISEINYKSISELQSIAASTQEQLAAMQQVATSVSDIEKISVELMQVVKS